MFCVFHYTLIHRLTDLSLSHTILRYVRTIIPMVYHHFITNRAPTMLASLLALLLSSLVSEQNRIMGLASLLLCLQVQYLGFPKYCQARGNPCPDGWYWQVINKGQEQYKYFHFCRRLTGWHSKEQVTKNDTRFSVVPRDYSQLYSYSYPMLGVIIMYSL